MPKLTNKIPNETPALSSSLTIEQRARILLNEVSQERAGYDTSAVHDTRKESFALEAICRALEYHQHAGATIATTQHNVSVDTWRDSQFLVATVSQDGTEIGIDHPTNANHRDVLKAYILLRDRLNRLIHARWLQRG